MATYKGIQGFSVEKLSSDPSTVIQGKLFYNDTSNVFKIGVPGSAAWSSSPSLNTGRKGSGNLGLQTAAICATGALPTGGSAHTSTLKSEAFNGTSWTEVEDTNDARYDVWGGGTQTAGIIGSGYQPVGGQRNTVETYNGTSWTTNPATMVNALSARGSSTAGTTTAMLAFGGQPTLNLTEQWDGTSWTAMNTMTTGRANLSGAGTSTAAIGMSGAVANPPPPNRFRSALCETWNGTSWTEVNNTNYAEQWRTGWGIQTAAMVVGGFQHPVAPTVRKVSESWNGTSWTNTSDLGTAKYNGGAGMGTQALGMILGGMSQSSGTATANTEQWYESPVSAETVTTS